MATVERVQIGEHVLYRGCALTVLPTLPDQSINCCVTSPPYFGLRDYGTATWEGGDAECEHKKPHADTGHVARTTLEGGTRTNAAQVGGYRDTCRLCGARRIDQQIGLEPTPAEYVAKLVAVFREVRRVLRDDGTLWLNLGDSYVNNPGWGRGGGSTLEGGKKSLSAGSHTHGRIAGLKSKDLIGIPWHVAFALQADGWYLRQDIIWHKPNPMPESVTDRCTKAHEYLFLLSKSSRYYYDAEAIHDDIDQTGRNKRSVWTVTTQPYSEAHFATFPPKLIEPCILAGCPKGGIVLDPFLGSGTTIAVAAQHWRKGVGIELNPAYLALARNRIGEAELAGTMFDATKPEMASLFEEPT